MEVRAMRRERAVLAVAAAGARQRQRHVARVSHAAHLIGTIPSVHRAALMLALLTLVACGGGGGAQGGPGAATLLLDFTPNAAHAGIYLATARGYDRAEGVRLRVRVPGASTDALKLLEAGRTDLAILDIHDLGLARERGRDVVGVLAIVQRPLAAVLAQRS